MYLRRYKGSLVHLQLRNSGVQSVRQVESTGGLYTWVGKNFIFVFMNIELKFSISFHFEYRPWTSNTSRTSTFVTCGKHASFHYYITVALATLECCLSLCQKFGHFIWRHTWHKSRLRTPALIFLLSIFLHFSQGWWKACQVYFYFLFSCSKKRHIILYFFFPPHTPLNGDPPLSSLVPPRGP